MHFNKILFKCPMPGIVFGNITKPFPRFCWLLRRCARPCACHVKANLNIQNCSVPVSFLHFWLLKYASCHNDMHFFDIVTSTSGSNMVYFVHFDFEMYFLPQRHAFFRHLNSQESWCVLYILSSKCTSRHNGVHFFDISISKKVLTSKCVLVRTWCVLYILISKCTSYHNGIYFFISQLAKWLRTRRFSEPIFRPSEATNYSKNTVFRDFPSFLRISIFF